MIGWTNWFGTGAATTLDMAIREAISKCLPDLADNVVAVVARGVRLSLDEKGYIRTTIEMQIYDTPSLWEAIHYTPDMPRTLEVDGIVSRTL